MPFIGEKKHAINVTAKVTIVKGRVENHEMSLFAFHRNGHGYNKAVY